MSIVTSNVLQIADYAVFCIILRFVSGIYKSTSFVIRDIYFLLMKASQIKLDCLAIRRNRSSFSQFSVTLSPT